MRQRSPVRASKPVARRHSAALSGLGLLVAVAAAGCSNPFSPEGSDPGVYKGASDPLFEQPADERDAALRERMELIQKRGAVVPDS